jgi:hypothetical protein
VVLGARTVGQLLLRIRSHPGDAQCAFGALGIELRALGRPDPHRSRAGEWGGDIAAVQAGKGAVRRVNRLNLSYLL